MWRELALPRHGPASYQSPNKTWSSLRVSSPAQLHFQLYLQKSQISYMPPYTWQIVTPSCLPCSSVCLAHLLTPASFWVSIQIITSSDSEYPGSTKNLTLGALHQQNGNTNVSVTAALRRHTDPRPVLTPSCQYMYQWQVLQLWPYGLQSARLLCPWDSPGKNIGEGCHVLL